MKRVGIFGTSGMAREAGDIAWELGYVPIYVARDQNELNAWSFSEDVFVENDVFKYSDISYVVGVGDNEARKNIAERYYENLKFCNLIHASATFGHKQRAAIDGQCGVIVCAGVRFTNNIKVGNFTIFNQNATIAHDVVVGSFVHIASGSAISGNVDIGDGCWIGAGAVINQGAAEKKMSIGQQTTIGSGAVVVSSCESGAVYVGVPAKRIK